MKLLLFSFLYAFFVNCNVAHSFDVVSVQTGFDNHGVVAAFGDKNGDKLVDVFIISPSGDKLDVILVYQNYDFDRLNLYNLTSNDADQYISGIMLADFDGDLKIDVLVCINRTLIINQTSTFRIALEVVWGNDSSPFQFSDTFLDEPVLFDYNADMLPDLLVEKTPGSWTVYLADVTNAFVAMEPLSHSPLAIPHSSAFINLREEYAADLFVTTQRGFEIYRNISDTAATVKYTYSQTSPNVTVFASSFGDFNQDGKLDHIIAVCEAQKCSIQVYDYTTQKWSTMLSLASSGQDDWGFQQLSYNHFQFQPTLHVGDYDMDGFPDIVTVLSSPTHGDRAFLLMNSRCTSENCGDYRRMFTIGQQLRLNFINSTLSVAFFDIGEDGSLDIVLTAVDQQSRPQLVFLNSDVAADTCFLKVTVVSGRSSGQPHYGLNVPGPMVKYTTTTTGGHQVHSSGGQLSQSAHFALQLPYVMFGLGQTPNFVDQVGVGIPNDMKSPKDRSRVWQQIIPNSQLVINPHPPDTPSRWLMKLFVMPSKQVWYTGIALAGTCVLGAIIVGALHLYEKHEDNKEKKQESQKFHFDAM